jgi:alpha-glucosidase
MQTARESCGPIESWEADARSVTLRHRQGVTRLEAAATDILRVRFTPAGDPACRRSWDVLEQLPPGPPIVVQETSGVVRVEGGALRVDIDLKQGRLGFHRGSEPLAHDLAGPQWRDVEIGETALTSVSDDALPAGPARRGLFLEKRMLPQEGYFGFGQRTGKLDRRHRRLTHWTVDRSSPGHSRGDDNLYQAHPVLVALRPELAWGLFLHSTWYSAFDVGAETEDVLTLFTLGGELDYFLLAGPTPAAVVEQLTRLTGRPSLPPLWALGYHQSRWSYASAREVEDIARGFRERGIPLDAIHIDIHYMRGYRVFTWDPERFPDPAGMIERLHGHGVRAVPIMDPGVKRDLEGGYAVAGEGVAQEYFIRRPDGEHFSGYVWPGESLFPDFCRASVRRWWGDWHAGLLECGADGIWCDMNEPSIADRPFQAPGVRDKPLPLATMQGEGKEQALHAEVHNLYGLLMARATYEGLLRLRPDRRPWVLTRSAYTSVQRYAATWMGDNSSWWEHLEMSLPQLTSMGLSGSPYVGVDIGGFYHNAFGELFARWMELGTFYPFMRSHTCEGSRAQEPWSFGATVEAVARAAIELRYRLLPYLYTLAHLAERTGAPPLRPLFYEFPDREDFHHIEDQVMLGPQLMIAPVTAPGVRRRLVELPEGIWYDFSTGVRVEHGPRVQPAPLGSPPMFVRGGAILTLGNLRQCTAEPLTELTVAVYPGPSGQWTLIEDDGESFAYREGLLAETTICVEEEPQAVTVKIGKRRGHFRPHPRELVLHLHLPARPRTVLKDGRAVTGWRWDAERRRAELRWPDDGAGHRVQALLNVDASPLLSRNR